MNTIDRIARLRAEATPGGKWHQASTVHEAHDPEAAALVILEGDAPNFYALCETNKSCEAAYIVALHNAWPEIEAVIRAAEAIDAHEIYKAIEFHGRYSPEYENLQKALAALSDTREGE